MLTPAKPTGSHWNHQQAGLLPLVWPLLPAILSLTQNPAGFAHSGPQQSPPWPNPAWVKTPQAGGSTASHSAISPRTPQCLGWILNPRTPFGTQGRSWRLEFVPHKHEMKCTKRHAYPGAPQGPAQFLWDSESGWVSMGSKSVCTLLGTGHQSLLLVRKARSRNQQEPLLVEG